MRGLAAAALALAVALPATAQRGGGHAGFSGHSAPAARSAPAFHGNFAPSAAHRYNGVPLVHPPVAYPSGVRTLPPPLHYPVAAPVHRPLFYQPNHGGTSNGTHRYNNHRYPYPKYAYAFYPSAVYVGSNGLFDDSFDDYDTPQQPAPEPDYSNNYPPDYAYPQAAPPLDSGYAYPQPPSPPEYSYAYPQPEPEYAQPAPAAPQMQYAPGSADTVTLIFKDGRPPEQIQNYLATRTTLTILDKGHRREVALNDLDLPATMKANRETGVNFELPATARQ
ncbi:MAG TPA: hypothetical protein VFW30_12125 [Bryocella sp.]|nr:hypothetical protein [Bryocella sp.]